MNLSNLDILLHHFDDDNIPQPIGTWVDATSGPVTFTTTEAGRYMITARYDNNETCINPTYFTVVTLPQMIITLHPTSPLCSGDQNGSIFRVLLNLCESECDD